MMKKEKKMLLITIVVVIILILVVVALKIVKKENKDNNPKGNETMNEVVSDEKYVTQLNDGTKVNNSEELNTTKKYKELEITNIQFTSQNGNSVLLATVKNTANTKSENEILKISIIGENDEILAEPLVSVSELAPGASRQLNVIVTADIVNAKNFRIEAEK